jgi:soluble lytic murein transglycosylase
VQILVSTARGYQREVGFEPTAENLRDAPTNLAFATQYMARLFRRYEVNPALVPAAYNAGHGSVGRWLRQDHARPFDEFVEEIPYEETRRYTRRVLQSYGIYSLLDTGEVPTFGSALPAD